MCDVSRSYWISVLSLIRSWWCSPWTTSASPWSPGVVDARCIWSTPGWRPGETHPPSPSWCAPSPANSCSGPSSLPETYCRDCRAAWAPLPRGRRSATVLHPGYPRGLNRGYPAWSWQASPRICDRSPGPPWSPAARWPPRASSDGGAESWSVSGGTVAAWWSRNSSSIRRSWCSSVPASIANVDSRWVWRCPSLQRCLPIAAARLRRSCYSQATTATTASPEREKKKN